jgi:hypothetical protein
LVEWAVRRAGGHIPDGSHNQWVYCRDHGTAVPVQVGEGTRGALLFIGRERVHHVVLSLGDGRTIEARGKAYGIGVWPMANRPWAYAARIPGVEYGSAPPAPTPTPREGEAGWDAFSGRLLRLATPRMRGEDVRLVQRALRTKGYSMATNGIFGRITDRNVRHFQRVANLAADGIVGPLTWRALVGVR